jgi:hypothetical protein
LLCSSSNGALSVPFDSEKRGEELKERRGSGESSAAETRLPNSTSEKGDAREDEAVEERSMVGVGKRDILQCRELL